ncbi:hypothetical protein [Sporosarcina sp. YIM B06819]|uniref:hypothetical protein n=1 Tax=Sporosarcina sp. YIM B06819 TaxID=3081769 RepID=UPI00298CAD93|nr:hypothetical protein [Sporosarcina sp. YIM B06819]
MKEFNMYVGHTTRSTNTPVLDKQKPSFIPNMDDLRKTKTSKTPKKKVNTKVPKQVLTAFLMYCVQENQFRKEAFSEMLRQFLKRSSRQQFYKIKTLYGEPINFEELEEANFEFDLDQFLEIQELKVVNRLTYIDIYTQVIVHFLDNKFADEKQSI